MEHIKTKLMPEEHVFKLFACCHLSLQMLTQRLSNILT